MKKLLAFSNRVMISLTTCKPGSPTHSYMYIDQNSVMIREYQSSETKSDLQKDINQIALTKADHINGETTKPQYIIIRFKYN